MKRRVKVRPKTDKKIFRKTAIRTKEINQRAMTPRGGIRL